MDCTIQDLETWTLIAKSRTPVMVSRWVAKRSGISSTRDGSIERAVQGRSDTTPRESAITGSRSTTRASIASWPGHGHRYYENDVPGLLRTVYSSYYLLLHLLITSSSIQELYEAERSSPINAQPPQSIQSRL